MKMAHKHSTRKWLNPKSSGDSGMVTWYVEGDLDSAYFIDATFSIWDCSRKINLNFSFSSAKAAKERADKIDFLITELQDMKDHLAIAYRENVMANGERDD